MVSATSAPRPSSRGSASSPPRECLDDSAQAGVLADGDGEADIHLTTGGDDGVGIEAAVSPRRELPSGPSMAHPPHRLPQEVGGATGDVGPALAQPGH